MSRRGTVETYTVVHSGSEAFKDQTPYVLAVVREDERKKLALVEGYSEGIEIRIGMEVEAVAEDGKGNTVYRFMRLEK